MTCQGCRLSTHTALGERGLVKCPLWIAFRNSSRTFPEDREVPMADSSTEHSGSIDTRIWRTFFRHRSYPRGLQCN